MTRLYKLNAACNRLATLGAKKPMLTVRHSTLHSLGTIETEKECCRTKRWSCELSRDHFCVSRHFYTRLCMCGRLNLLIWNPSCCFICFIMFHCFIKSFLGWFISVLLFIRFIRKSQDAKLVSTSLFESLLVSFCQFLTSSGVPWEASCLDTWPELSKRNRRVCRVYTAETWWDLFWKAQTKWFIEFRPKISEHCQSLRKIPVFC